MSTDACIEHVKNVVRTGVRPGPMLALHHIMVLRKELKLLQLESLCPVVALLGASGGKTGSGGFSCAGDVQLIFVIPVTDDGFQTKAAPSEMAIALQNSSR